MVSQNITAMRGAPEQVKATDAWWGDEPITVLALETAKRFRWVYLPTATFRKLLDVVPAL